jgi:hypothetical protein
MRRETVKLRAKLGYVVETSILPIPTEEQTRAFVSYVATAHSWYKHLRRDAGTLFVFVLDPHVMMLTSGNGRFRKAKAGDNALFHYSSMPTDKYRERYGFWTFFNGGQLSHKKYCGPEEHCTSPTTTPVLPIYASNGRRIPPPVELVRAGSSWLTAYVYGAIGDEPDRSDDDRRRRVEQQGTLETLQGFLSLLRRRQTELGLRSRDGSSLLCARACASTNSS